MFKNYLKGAYRNFKKRKSHTIINVLGLAIGITSCLLIAIYVLHAFSYDTQFPKGDRLYRITQTSITPDKNETNATTPFPLGPTLQAEFPRLIDKTVRLYNTLDDEHTFILRGDSTNPVRNSFLESDFFFVDSTFINAFDIKLIRGNPATALDKPLSLVITKAKARKFFGDANPIGKHINFETRRMNMTVTGVMEPFPANSHIGVDMLASSNSLNNYFTHPENFRQDWFFTNTWTYIMLKKGVNPAELKRQFPDFIKKYYSKNRDKDETFKLSIQPLAGIHLHSNLNYEIEPNGSIFNVWLFITAALLLLIIACINFMNLATARATERRQEVGMRKALGASRGQLFWQFMGESFLLTFIAFVLGGLLTALLLPIFNGLIGGHLAVNLFQNPSLLLWGGGLFIVVGLLAGLYPAAYLSGFSPHQIIGGSAGRGRGGSALRKGLVTAQFALTALLVIGTLIVFLQLRHMQQKELGYDKSRIVLMPIKQNLIAWEYPDFKKRVEQSSAIQSVTGIAKILGSDKVDSWKIAPAGEGGVKGETNHTLWVTYDFVKTFGLEVVAGRSFSKDYGTDGARSILINQKMVQKMGYDDPHEALGALFYYTSKHGKKNPMQVVGVVRDFNYTTIKKPVKPTVISLSHSQSSRLGAIGFAAAKVATGRTRDGLAKLKKVWNDIDYIDPFSYSFQDQELEKTYAYQAKTRTVLSVFSVLCIIVACLGLFGLASFTAAQRTREIGIRKTLGASVSSIVVLLSKEYSKLVLVANIIIWPVMYFLARQWLKNFAYRIDLGWNIVILFVSVAVASLLICLATVAWQSVSAALINPVESIRQE